MPFDESSLTPQGHVGEDTAVTAALGGDVPRDVTAHLGECTTCRAEVDAWARLVSTARSGERVEPVEPPPGTWDAVAREAGLTHAVPAEAGPTVDVRTTSGPVVVPLTGGAGRAPRRPRARRRWWPVAAAAAVGLGLGIGGTRVLSDAPSPRPQVVSSATLEPLQDGPEVASGTAEVTQDGGGRRLELAVTGVQDPADGFLEAWLLDADGGLVSLGTVSGGSVSYVLPPDLDLTRFDVVDVSREAFDGDPGHSADSLLRGVLSTGA